MKETKTIIKRKGEQGITLIALVVTIVVLLILAGVTINFVLGDGGILEKARLAANKTNNAIGEEQNLTENFENQVNEYVNGETPKLNEYIGKKMTQTKTMQDSKGKKLTVPKGFKLVDPNEDETVEYADKSNPKVDEGIVIEDEEGNQFVWVPVEDIKEFKLRSWNGETISEEPAENAYWPMDGFVAQLYQENQNVLSNMGKNSNENTQSKASADFNDISNLIKKVSNIASSNRAGDDAIGLENYMNNSIEKYQGFYVGRYELSYNETTKKLETEKDKTPYCESGSKLNSMISEMNRELIDTKIVDTGSGTTGKVETYRENLSDISRQLIYGEQWDTLMNWINKTNPSYDNNGNYTETIAKTGSNKSYSVNNIYDLSGNVGEWSCEGYGKGIENASSEKLSSGYKINRASSETIVYRGKDLELRKANTRNNVDPEENSTNVGGRMAFFIAPEEIVTTQPVLSLIG